MYDVTSHDECRKPIIGPKQHLGICFVYLIGVRSQFAGVTQRRSEGIRHKAKQNCPTHLGDSFKKNTYFKKSQVEDRTFTL